MFRKDGGAVGASANHNDAIPGCGEKGVPSKNRVFLDHRFGQLKVQGSPFVHVGMELPQESDFPVKLTQEGFTSNLRLLPISPVL